MYAVTKRHFLGMLLTLYIYGYNEIIYNSMEPGDVPANNSVLSSTNLYIDSF